MKKRRIVVLGGGMASLVTAFELTRTPEQRRRSQITVYQHGHRLGGKGASGVNPEAHDRIEEHGLHVLYGFYENVFRVLRECYEELGRPPDAPLATWRDAVSPQHLIVVPERVNGSWLHWPLYMPANDEVPGDGAALDDPWRYLTRLLDWAHVLVRQWVSVRPEDYPTEWPEELCESFDAPGTSVLRRALQRLMKGSGEVSGLVLAELARRLVRVMPDLPRENSEDRRSLLWLIGRSLDWVWARAGVTTEMRRTRILLDLALTVVRGLLIDGLVASPQRWFAIDDEDFRAWLTRHGARTETVQGAIVTGLYHAGFSAFEPLGAGTIVHALLRMVCTYKGAILYRMQAGMGDTVFAPLFTVLARRGVRFEFFHSVRRLELSDDRRRVGRVVIDRQATLRDGEYEPLVDVKGLPCWPARPRLEQLVEGDALRAGGHDLESWWDRWPGVGELVLEDGRDYDDIVLGLSLGVLPSVCKELVDDATNPRFRQMVERVRTTQTQAAQLWIDRDLAGLQWNGSAGKHLPILIPWAEPFDTWSDMTYLVGRESWPQAHTPRHLAYLCAPLLDEEAPPPRDDHGYPEREHRRVRTHLERWLRASAPALWTGAAATGGEPFDWSSLVDPEERSGSARLDAQYWCATRHPSDRYVLSVPGSNRCRLRAHESGYDNLVLAGDWTLTALSIGCLEAATMSGMAAARVLDGECRRAYGDWLPPPPEPVATSVAASVGTTLPSYISNGQLIAIPPLRMRTMLTLFFLDADIHKLTALCDRYLNLPGSTTVYRPLAPRVVLYCSTAETGPIDDPIGWCPEKDFGIWVPVVSRDSGGATRFLAFTPWLWVDSGVAMVGGREVYGFAKELATLHMPIDPADGEEYSIDTLVLPRYAPDARVVERRLLTIRPLPGVAARLRAFATAGGHAVHELEHLLTPGVPSSYWGFARHVVQRRELRLVFLKQFPDVVDPTRACYQAVVEAPVRITGGVRGGLLPGAWSVTVGSCVSHPIVDALGLTTRRRSATESELTSRAPAWLAFDARVEPGSIVFERAAQRNGNG